MTTPFIDIPILQVRPNCLLVYAQREWLISRRKKDKTKKIAQFKGKRAYSGKTTKLNVKRMKRVLNTLVAQARWQTVNNPTSGSKYRFLINFVTLTLPGPQGSVTDKDLKKHVLDPWIKSARRVLDLQSYFWRAERQKNGNLHFHLATDTYLPYDKLRDSWNKRLNALGFIDRFEAKHGHRHPNSTDVHSVKNIANLPGYLVKYMTKDFITEKDMRIITGQKFKAGSKPHKAAMKRLEEIFNLSDIPINGKIWDCSANLKQPHRCSMVLETNANDIWLEEQNARPDNTTHTDKCSFIVYNRDEFLTMLRGDLKIRYDEWLETMRFKAA